MTVALRHGDSRAIDVAFWKRRCGPVNVGKKNWRRTYVSFSTPPLSLPTALQNSSASPRVFEGKRKLQKVLEKFKNNNACRKKHITDYNAAKLEG